MINFVNDWNAAVSILICST